MNNDTNLRKMSSLTERKKENTEIDIMKEKKQTHTKKKIGKLCVALVIY